MQWVDAAESYFDAEDYERAVDRAGWALEILTPAVETLVETTIRHTQDTYPGGVTMVLAPMEEDMRELRSEAQSRA